MTPWMLETSPEEEVIFFNHWVTDTIEKKTVFRPNESDPIILKPTKTEQVWMKEKGFIGAWMTYSFGTLTNPFNMAYQGGSAGALWKVGFYGSLRSALATEFFWGAMIIGFATALADPEHMYTAPGQSPVDIWFVGATSLPGPMQLAWNRKLRVLGG